MGNVDDKAIEHGTETIVSSFTPAIEDYFRKTTRFGLGWDSAWVYTIVRDDEGQRYSLTRGYEKASSSMFMSCRMSDDLSQVSPRLFKSMFKGFVLNEKVPDQDKVIAMSAPSRHSFKVELEPQRLHWQEENGEVDLALEAMGPACRILSPGSAVNEEMYYTSELCTVTGSVMGKAVTGFGGIDQSWLPHGIAWTQSKTYLYMESYWLVWANRYEDGSTDYGIAGYGPGGWNLSYYVIDGQPVISNDNEFQVKYADEGYPSELDIRLGSNRFKWTVDSRMSEIKGYVLWISGKMINLGLDKKPVDGYSMYEYRPFGQF